MKKLKVYGTALAALVSMGCGLQFVGAVDLGAPIFPNYLYAFLLWFAGFGLLFVAQYMAEVYGFFSDWEDDD